MADLLAGDLIKAENPALAALAAKAYAPRSVRPIWLQIYDRLADAIRQDVVPPGSRLPGEVYLADLFGVNRITMRRALALHQNEGLLQARKGVGIFVRPRPRRFLIRNDMQFAESLLVDGGSISSKNLWLGRGKASPEAAQLFGIAPDEQVILLHRLRQLDGAPIYVSRKEFPILRFPDFENRYHESGSVRAVFRSAGIESYRRSETRVMGGFASKEEAEILEISPQTPVQYVTSINRDVSGQVIEFNRGCWPMASVELVFAAAD
ncbi:GntR family transcriptional regulator [Nitratireductor kimnyeongensis]|uniref:GntR family transcriptional regulator n=1 Tax=Nitratireductor kimnyeongensis TaxID=430679 RepID=A0ABW0T5X3_9HYPH|nr:GntR family transcriptional regulator [Nitratireductor kimnyeongensis]QZZ34796.1 GntR family transcriptional regulator [Nitratireductor kimnyeongensis]